MRGKPEAGAIEEALRRGFAMRLKRLRGERRWSQEDAAHECGVSVRVVSRVETAQNDVKFSTLARLAAGFGVEPWRLLK